MSDQHEATEDARATLAEQIPLMREAFRACWGLLYADGNRERPPRLLRPGEEQSPRAAKCGSCEHPVTDHDPECLRAGCRCHSVVTWPSTVGWAEWTGPGKAEAVYNRATAELQRTHDALFQVHAVPSKWVSPALDRAPSNTQPLRLDLVLHGVDLLSSSLRHVGADLTEMEADKLREAAGHAQAAVRALGKAEDQVDEVEWRELSQPRCAVPGCRVTIEADGLCTEHHEASPAELAALERCVHCRAKPPEPHRKWCSRCRRAHQSDRMSCTVCGLGQEAAS